MSFTQLIRMVEGDLHSARHSMVDFGEYDDHPATEVGWGVGFLFGIAFTIAYPKLALKVAKAVFDEKSYGVYRAVDFVAGGLQDSMFYKPPTNAEHLDKLVEIKRDTYPES